MSALPTPFGCRWCGIEKRPHFQQWKAPVGWHKWERPTDEQIKERLLARRAARVSVREPLSVERLAEYAALAAAATPGSWEVLPSGSSWLIGSDRVGVTVTTVDSETYRVPGDDHCDAEYAARRAQADAAFVAVARSAVPELLAEVERLRAERAELVQQIGGISDATARALADRDRAEEERLRARVAELERPAIEAKRNEIRQSYAELIATCTETKDYEGAFDVQCRLREREEQWKREDAEAGKDTPSRGESTRDAELTVYRASHDSIVMGLYTTRQAAYEHCEAHELRDDPISPMAWEVDEDGVAELVRWRIPDATKPTGYVVTPLTVATAYDEAADE
ncbi:hypothetical protein [Streptomyces pini]|uniref:Uncharacterized protein n=1 Tax=Streptomyces pini TaxID=1520580 RepID=A0A1I4C4I2_9ACTN|nr:hypothetical protein [Streptomyces pini]SFK75076.1 hypothetical protein SAMN05192584_108225 [Streptomyces pini]